jgi:hypothetical protein
MPEKIVLPHRDPTDADLKWFANLPDRDDPLDSLTPSERERWWRCVSYCVRFVAETPEGFPPETQALWPEVLELARNRASEMQARGVLQITQGDDGLEFWLQLPH